MKNKLYRAEVTSIKRYELDTGDQRYRADDERNQKNTSRNVRFFKEIRCLGDCIGSYGQLVDGPDHFEWEQIGHYANGSEYQRPDTKDITKLLKSDLPEEIKDLLKTSKK